MAMTLTIINSDKFLRRYPHHRSSDLNICYFGHIMQRA
jgi:hypothetical protein